MSGLNAELHALHEHYIESVNQAVAADDLALVASLGEEYDDEAIRLIIDAAGPTPTLPPRLSTTLPPRTPTSASPGLRSLVRRLKNRRAA